MEKEALNIVNNPSGEYTGLVRIANETIRRQFSGRLEDGLYYRLGGRFMMTPSGAPGTVSSATWYFGIQAEQPDNVLSGTVNHFVGLKLTGASLTHDATDDHYGNAVVQPCLIQNNTETLGTSVYTGALAGRGPNECCPIYLELNFSNSSQIGFRVAGLPYGSPGTNATWGEFYNRMANVVGTNPTGTTYSTLEQTISWTTDFETDRAAYGDLDTVVVAWDQTDPTLEVCTVQLNRIVT